MLCYDCYAVWVVSSAVEHSAFNRLVLGSNPRRPILKGGILAILWKGLSEETIDPFPFGCNKKARPIGRTSGLAIVVQGKLVGMGTDAHGQDLHIQLVGNPGLDQVFGKDIAL